MKKSTPVKSAFTIIEVTIAMGFAGVLFLTIVVITTNILGLYQKGLTIRSVNSAGQELIDDFSRAIASAPLTSLKSLCGSIANANERKSCENDNAYLFTFQSVNSDASVTMTNGEATGGKIPLNGAFCTGKYSYIWNSGYTQFVSNSEVKIKNSNQSIRLLRVDDTGHHICKQRLKQNSDGTNIKYELNSSTKNFTYNLSGFTYNEILAKNEDNLYLYDFYVFNPTQDNITEHSFYSGTFILGTKAGNINIRSANGGYCTDTPTDLSTDFDYCALNKYNFAMRASGKAQ